MMPGKSYLPFSLCPQPFHWSAGRAMKRPNLKAGTDLEIQYNNTEEGVTFI